MWDPNRLVDLEERPHALVDTGIAPQPGATATFLTLAHVPMDVLVEFLLESTVKFLRSNKFIG